jgi:hypothetical protein
MVNKAKEIIIPDKHVFRAIFLYVGQGESTLLVVPSENRHKYILIDSHQGEYSAGIC